MPMLRLPSACARRAALALLAAAAALPAARAVGTCLTDETFSDPSVTHLDFASATLVNNTLHEKGGELRLDGVGIIRNTPVSLVVTDASPDNSYPNITDAWDANEVLNGLYGTLGRINLQAVKGKAGSGKGTFKFCLVDTETGAPTAAEKFVFGMYDIDERSNMNPPRFERALFQTQSATAFQLWPDSDRSDVRVDCADGSAAPCGTARTVLHSTSDGADENPSDPDNLTNKQLKGSVAVTFDNTDCFEVEYEIYCPRNVENCGGGGSFLWGGASEKLVTAGECVAIVPASDAPSGAPTDADCVPFLIEDGTCTKPPTLEQCEEAANELDYHWEAKPIDSSIMNKPIDHLPGGCFAKRRNSNEEIIKVRYNSHTDSGTNCGQDTGAGPAGPKFTKLCVCCE